MGIRVQVYPLKGYSISVPLKHTARVPQASITDDQREIVSARLGNRLRVAGMADIVDFDESRSGPRVGTLLRKTRETFGAWADPSIRSTVGRTARITQLETGGQARHPPFIADSRTRPERAAI